MFENLSERLDRSFKLLKGEGKITEINVAETLKDVRKALLDADVNYKVAKSFTDTVKEKALEYDIPVYQPVKVGEEEFIETLRGLDPEVIVVAAFGQILPKEILQMTPYGCINVHASLLPKYRGAAPIQWAVIDGEKVSGVTTMQMNEGLDTGDMIMKTEVPLAEDETGGSLHDKLAKAGAKLCVETLKALEDKTATWETQGESPTAYAKMLDKKLGDIDWSKSAKAIECLIRGLNPWPSAYTDWNGKVMKTVSYTHLRAHET